LFVIRSQTFKCFELISDLWNSKDYNPMAPPSSCHSDFSTTIDCSFSKVADLSRAIPEKIQHIFTSMRSSLLNIITRWERSGQGEGGWDPETDSGTQEDEGAASDDGDNPSPTTVAAGLGELAGRPARALNM
jgi:hypothetical protein